MKLINNIIITGTILLSSHTLKAAELDFNREYICNVFETNNARIPLGSQTIGTVTLEMIAKGSIPLQGGAVIDLLYDQSVREKFWGASLCIRERNDPASVV